MLQCCADLVRSTEFGVLGSDADPVGFREECDFRDVEFRERFKAPIEVSSCLSKSEDVFNERGSAWGGGV